MKLSSLAAIAILLAAGVAHAAAAEWSYSKAENTVSNIAQTFVVNSVKPKDVEAVMSRFRLNAEAYGVAHGFNKCRELIVIGTGVAHGNISYGMICEDKKTLLVCADEMLGRIALKAVGGKSVADKGMLALFTANNCYGG